MMIVLAVIGIVGSLFIIGIAFNFLLTIISFIIRYPLYVAAFVWLASQTITDGAYGFFRALFELLVFGGVLIGFARLVAYFIVSIQGKKHQSDDE